MVHKQSRSKRRRNSLIFMAAGLALIVGAEGWYLTRGSSPSTPVSRPVANIGQVPAAPPTSIAAGAHPSVGIKPSSVQIPSLSINSLVVPVDVSVGGVLGVPSNPLTVGWWSGGPKPGSAIGTSVLTSHINWNGVPGAFAKLGQIRVGAQVIVESAGSSEAFTVTGVRVYEKADLPAQTVFSQSVSGRLALITCGGPFDPRTGHYEDNVVAYAVPSANTTN